MSPDPEPIFGGKHWLLGLTLITTYIVAHIFTLRIRIDESGSKRAAGWSQQKPGSGHGFIPMLLVLWIQTMSPDPKAVGGSQHKLFKLTVITIFPVALI